MEESHEGVTGGHYGGHATSRKVLLIGLWWPTLNSDATDYVRSCDVYQRTRKSSKRDEISLVAPVTLQPFDKWDVDFVGPINRLGKRTSAWYIITATDYLMRWVEATPIVYCTSVTAGRFLFDNIVTRFRCPRILMRNQGSHFINRTVSALT